MRFSIVATLSLLAASAAAIPHGGHGGEDGVSSHRQYRRAGETWKTFTGAKVKYPQAGDKKNNRAGAPGPAAGHTDSHMRFKQESGGKITSYNTHVKNTNPQNPSAFVPGARFRDNQHSGGSTHAGIQGATYYPTGSGRAHPATTNQMPTKSGSKDDSHLGRHAPAAHGRHSEAPFRRELPRGGSRDDSHIGRHAHAAHGRHQEAPFRR